MKKGEADSLSVNALADRLKRDRRTIRRLLDQAGVEPAEHRHGCPRYRLEDAQRVLAMHQHTRDRAGDARRKLLEAQWRKIEVQTGILRRDYVPTADVERWGAELGAIVRRTLQNIPQTFAPRVVGVTVAEAEELLRDAVHEALDHLHSLPVGPLACPKCGAKVTGDESRAAC